MIRPTALLAYTTLLFAPLARVANAQSEDQHAWDTSEVPVQWVELPSIGPELVTVVVQLDGQSVTLELRQHDLRAPGFALLVQGDDGVLREHTAAAPSTYRGTLLEDPGSRVAASLTDVGLHALITKSDGRGFAVQPLSTVDLTAPRGAHLVHRVDQAPVLSNAACGVPGSSGGALSALPASPGGVAQGTGLRVAELAIDADVEFFNLKGSSVSNALADIENVINGVDALFQTYIGVKFELTVVLVRTANPDPYTTNSPGGLLSEVSSEWVGNLFGYQRDVVHLFTGRNLVGSVIGIANPGCLCQGCHSLAQQTLSSYTSRVALSAHEIGHQFGAGHCDGAGSGCNIMCSGLGACGPLNQFSQAAQIGMGYGLSTASCIPDLEPAVALPVQENFDAGLIDPALWLVNDDVELDSLALYEPSGVTALHFDATGALPQDQDELWSNDLTYSAGAWFLTFYAEHRGVPTGGALVVDYRDASGNWFELDRVVSDGTDQNGFEQVVFAVPSAAAFDGGRLRLRTELTALGQDFWIDNLSLSTDGDPCVIPHGFCLGKLNSDGCAPLITSVGTPSLTGGGIFEITTLGVVAQKPGLMFYGYAESFLPFQGGTLCAAPPNRRTDIQQSGGVVGIPCDGAFTFDMGAHIQSGLDPLLVAGQNVYCQHWYRDNLSPSQTGLSNGLRFEICD